MDKHTSSSSPPQKQQKQQGVLVHRSFVPFFLCATTSDRSLAGGHVNGCLQRCRRRHRQCPPPQRATPPCLLAVCTDERRNGPCRVSAPQRTAPEEGKGREEEREVHYTAALRRTVPPPEPELFDLFEEPGGGAARPQGPQTGVQRHTVEHLADLAPWCKFSMFLCRRREKSWRTS